MLSSSMEDGVTTNEFYYLLLVVGGFGAFAAGLSMTTIQYRAWLRRPAAKVSPGLASSNDLGDAGRASNLADAA